MTLVETEFTVAGDVSTFEVEPFRKQLLDHFTKDEHADSGVQNVTVTMSAGSVVLDVGILAAEGATAVQTDLTTTSVANMSANWFGGNVTVESRGNVTVTTTALLVLAPSPPPPVPALPPLPSSPPPLLPPPSQPPSGSSTPAGPPPSSTPYAESPSPPVTELGLPNTTELGEFQAALTADQGTDTTTIVLLIAIPVAVIAMLFFIFCAVRIRYAQKTDAELDQLSAQLKQTKPTQQSPPPFAAELDKTSAVADETAGQVPRADSLWNRPTGTPDRRADRRSRDHEDVFRASFREELNQPATPSSARGTVYEAQFAMLHAAEKEIAGGDSSDGESSTSSEEDKEQLSRFKQLARASLVAISASGTERASASAPEVTETPSVSEPNAEVPMTSPRSPRVFNRSVTVTQSVITETPSVSEPNAEVPMASPRPPRVFKRTSVTSPEESTSLGDTPYP